MNKSIIWGNRVSRALALAVMVALTQALPAAAQINAPADPAYADMVNSSSTKLNAALTSVGPLVFGILGVMAALAFAWKMFKKAAQPK